MPQLDDPNFTRAVVLMVEHNDEGSFGLIVNHESELDVAKLLTALEVEWCGPWDQKVWSGGPVMPSSGWVLHSGCSELAPAAATLDEALEGAGTVRLGEELFLSTSEENIQVLAENPPANTRFLLGYAGWGPGQLASEMARGSWLHADVNAELLFDAPADAMWQQALASLGIDPEAIVQGRGIH